AHVDGGGRLREDVPVLDDDERAELIDSGLQGDLAVRPDAHDSVASGREDEGLAWPSHPVRAATGDRKRGREVGRVEGIGNDERLGVEDMRGDGLRTGVA